MVERVARALCIADGKSPNEDRRMTPQGNGVFIMADVHIEHPEWWRVYVPGARAAILAMREPTPAVLAMERWVPNATWSEMIDEVLK